MAAPAIARQLTRPGKVAGESLTEVGSFMVFSYKALYHAVYDIVIKLKFPKEVLRHVSDIVIGVGAYVIGGGMIFVIGILAMAGGATVGVQAFNGLSQLGAEAFVGLAGAYANVRELTPLIAAVGIAAQVGSSFTAEIGAMRISDEVDALEVMSIPSLVFLVSTRIVAVVLAIVPLYLFALFTSFFATRLITTELFGMSPGIYDYYFNLYLPPIDVFFSVAKIVVFALIITLIHCFYGYFAKGGPAGVGQATGKAIRTTIIVVVLTNLFLSFLFWGGSSTVSLTG